MPGYNVALDVPFCLLLKVSKLLEEHRGELGTRNGTRALACRDQAIFVLAWFRDSPGIRRLGQGFGTSQATAYRYKDEGVAVLAAQAPTLHPHLLPLVRRQETQRAPMTSPPPACWSCLTCGRG